MRAIQEERGLQCLRFKESEPRDACDSRKARSAWAAIQGERALQCLRFKKSALATPAIQGKRAPQRLRFKESEKARAAEKERDFCGRQEARLAAEMKRLKRNPSNRYLAGLLGLPRGSVNSSLARMKKRLYALKNEDSTSDIE